MADAYAKYEEIIEACGEERRSGSDGLDLDTELKLAIASRLGSTTATSSRR